MKPQMNKGKNTASQMNSVAIDASSALADAAEGESLLQVKGDRLYTEWSTDSRSENYEKIVNESIDRVNHLLGAQGFQLNHDTGGFENKDGFSVGGDNWAVVRKAN